MSSLSISDRERFSVQDLVGQYAVRAVPIKFKPPERPYDFSFTHEPFLILFKDGKYFAKEGGPLHTEYELSSNFLDHQWIKVNPHENDLCEAHLKKLLEIFQYKIIPKL